MVAQSLPVPRLTLRLLGRFHVVPHEEPCRRKGEWLLALLALRHGREVERSWLAGTLWPEASESQALYDLRRELSRLRRVLGPEARRLRPGARGTITLDLAGADVDLRDFDEAVGRDDDRALERAAELYRGPLLAGCDEAWAIEEREARRRAYLRALMMLAGRARSPAVAATWYRRAVAEDPLDEASARGLMRALADDGAAAAALQVYRTLRLALEREVAVPPSAETSALYREIRAARPSAPPAQLPRLPRPLSGLVGRDREAAEIATRLETARLVTLVGSGGVGKSRLAIRVAGDLEREVCFAALGGLDDATLVASAVETALGLREAPDRPAARHIATAIGERALLLVLDDCEHVVTACAALAAFLLEECPRLTIVATSRQSLGVPGEVAWRVPSLGAADAVRLFVERAAEVTSAVPDAEVVARICQRLDGIPLAIELAAARTRVLTPAQIAERLDDRFGLLGGGRSPHPRHRTLRATVDWSYRLLADEERLLLERLSSFAGGFSLADASALHGGAALDLLDELVDKSLVVFAGRYHLVETIRDYARERLAERGELDATRQRHLAHFLALAEQAEPHLFAGACQQAWMDRLEDAVADLRAALDFAEADPARVDEQLRLASSLAWFWFGSSRLGEARRRLAAALQRADLVDDGLRARVLAAAGHAELWGRDPAAARGLLAGSLALARGLGDRRLVAYILCAAGTERLSVGDHAGARASLAEAAALARAIDDPSLLCFALHCSGGDSLAEALLLARRHGYTIAAGHILRELGNVARQRGDRDGAVAAYLESIDSFAEAGCGVPQAFDALGDLWLGEGQIARAGRLLGCAEAHHERLGVTLLPAHNPDRQRARAIARGQEAELDAAWEEGRTADLAALVAEVRATGRPRPER